MTTAQRIMLLVAILGAGVAIFMAMAATQLAYSAYSIAVQASQDASQTAWAVDEMGAIRGFPE